MLTSVNGVHIRWMQLSCGYALLLLLVVLWCALLRSLSSRTPPGAPASGDPVASALQPLLGPMLAATLSAGGKTPEVQRVVCSVWWPSLFVLGMVMMCRDVVLVL
jgi:hypothetical protein